MKLPTYQEELLQKIPSVVRRRFWRSSLKDVHKSIKTYQSLIADLSADHYKPYIGITLKVFDDWQHRIETKKKELLRMESHIKEETHAK